MTIPEIGLREQILVTAKSLFIQQGYHGLAMRQISEAVGVSKAALYYHFKDKEELFLAILSGYLNEIEAAIDKIMAKPVSSSEHIRLFAEYILKQPADQRAVTPDLAMAPTVHLLDFGTRDLMLMLGILALAFTYRRAFMNLRAKA